MCEVLEVPRSTFYQSLNKTTSNRERENNELTKAIVTIHKGYKVNQNRVQRLMKKGMCKLLLDNVILSIDTAFYGF